MGRLIAFVALALVTVLFAHAPLLRSGLLARDYAGLLHAAHGPAASAWSSRTLFGVPPPGLQAWTFRLEQLALLLACALALRSLLERLLEPRLGASAARRAGWGAALLLLVHPRALLAVGDAGARADLVALALASWSAAAFLKGRQTHADAWTSAGLALFLVSGLASPAGAPLAIVVAVAEFACVRRHRKRSLRLRTAATTVAVFGAAVLLPRAFLSGESAGSDGSAPATWSLAGSTLLRLFLPLSEESRWTSGALAGGVLLAALWPAFPAARQAPRLWSGMLLLWGVGLALALGSTAILGGELPAVAVWCAGLGVATTVRTARSRPLRETLVILGFAVLAHLQARPLSALARAEGRLWSELAPLVHSHPGSILVLDPPAATVPHLGWLFHPRLLGATSVEAAFSPGRVRGLTSQAFLVLAGTEALAPLRAEQALVVRASQVSGPSAALVARRLAPRRPATPERLTWRSLTHTPSPPLDPMDWEAARIVADLAGTPRQIDQLGWDVDAGTSGVIDGAVAERGGRLVAEFDLAGSLAWRLGGTIRNLRVEKGVRGIERGELEARFAELPLNGEPLPRGADWLLPLRSRDQAEAGGTHVLFLLALSDFEVLEVAPALDAEGNLIAPGAEGFRIRKSSADLAWVLDYRIGTRVLQRARGIVH